MNKISTILVPFDFSSSSRAALEYAVNFVGDKESIELLVVHVKNDEDTRIAKEITIEQLRFNAKLKIPLEWITVHGSLTESLLEVQENRKVAMVIMGTSGASDQAKVSNTSKFVTKVNCPVLVIPDKNQEFQIKNIALVLGKEEIDDRHVLEILLEISQKFNAKVHVLTIENTSETYGYSEADRKNENLLEHYLENFYSEHTFLENTDVVKGIISHAQKNEMDMIAILPRNHAERSNPSEGRLTEMLTLKSPIPILAID